MHRFVLINRDQAKQVEAQQRHEFVAHVLQEMGLPEDLLNECLPEAVEEFTSDKKLKLRELLSKFNIRIISDLDNGLKIYVDGEQVAEWCKCSFIWKEDLSELDPNQRLYAEMHMNYWIFDKDV